MNDHPTITLAQALIERDSITPEDKGCQQLIADRLADCGFKIEQLNFDEVDNLWATHGTGSPVFVFAGHTDVVPPGPADQWCHLPFSAQIENGLLYGRGAADMKGSVAAMVHALEMFVSENPNHPGTVALLLTSDEEGPAINGIRKVMEQFNEQGVKLDYCVIGEPSSSEILGDTIKVGRRGSISGWLTVHGKEGHIAYPHMASNPIHPLGDIITCLTRQTWDKGNDFFPPTSFQISNVLAGEGTGNVIPSEAKINFNFRYSSELDEQTIIEQTHRILDKLDIQYSLEWQAFGKPFITSGGKLIDTTKAVIKSFTGLETELSTSGGTSDGRFIAPTGTEVVELGPISASIHKVDEHASVRDLVKLTEIYTQICEKVLY